MTAKRKFGWGAALLLLLAACFVYYLVTGMRSAGTISYAQLRQLFQDEKVQEFAISNTRLTAKLQDGSTVSCDLYDFQVFYNDLNDLVVQQNQQGIIKDYTYRADHSTNWLQILLPYVAVILGFILLMNLMARMTGAGPGGAQDRMSHFGDARIQDVPQDSKVSFRDVAGADEEKEEQAQLRRDYIDSVKANLKSQLNTLYVLDEKTGKKTKIVDFERERAARAGKKKENR